MATHASPPHLAHPHVGKLGDPLDERTAHHRMGLRPLAGRGTCGRVARAAMPRQPALAVLLRREAVR
eukprot:1449220-Lingulodinium_polyedra.AAC.1